MGSKLDIGEWSSLRPATRAKALYEVVQRMLRILEIYFSGLLIIESAHLNHVYLVLRKLAELLSEEFPAIKEALDEVLGVFPNLYESIGHPDSPDENWEFSTPLINTLKAQLSDAILETMGAPDDKIPSDLEHLLTNVDRRLAELAKQKGQQEAAWLRSIEETAERHSNVFGIKPAVETRQVTLSQEDEDRFRMHRFKCKIPIHITGKTEGQKGNVVQIGSREAVITDVPFGLFLRLVVALLDTEDGFVALGNMHSGGGLSDEGFYEPAGLEQALSRLRQPFRTALGHFKTKDFIERRRGNIRLSTGSPYVTWDRKALLDHPDGVIRELARKLPEAQGTEEISPAP